MTSPYSKTHTIAGQPLYFTEQGQGNTLVFIHGLLGNKIQWQAQIQALEADYRCIAIDLWGHGQSQVFPENTANLKDIAGQLLNLLTELNINQCSLIALGTGCAIASEMALLAPSKINALVMINGFIGFEPEVNCAKYQLMLDDIIANKSVSAALAQQLASLFFSSANLMTESKAASAKTEHQVTESPIPDSTAISLAKALTALNAAQLAALVKFAPMAIYKRDTLEDAEKLCLPSLIIASNHNQLRTPLEAYLMQDTIDGSQLVQIASAGHWVHLEQAEQLNPLIKDFLQQRIN
ncbi:alpha/beta fold hydrolase [Shewanella sp. SR44-3]|uniref:alpha/beta fold hydrolase n=1 Tax=Shewanella sp. SR44-3 TaxID=2760936 RepID=UPI0015FE762C|nr:alpha/beta hydrolase [Shewanella sp. SR44-3]MBB1267807.1 alpha/beta hydrolase [Shewanella sp. SR44-3]